jgi:hypothetical protein
MASCTTESGRVYRLVGVPGLCPEGKRALDGWMRLYHLEELRDVTAEVFLAIQDAQTAARTMH